MSNYNYKYIFQPDGMVIKAAPYEDNAATLTIIPEGGLFKDI